MIYNVDKPEKTEGYSAHFPRSIDLTDEKNAAGFVGTAFDNGLKALAAELCKALGVNEIEFLNIDFTARTWKPVETEEEKLKRADSVREIERREQEILKEKRPSLALGPSGGEGPML
jgi:hypothetical protein